MLESRTSSLLESRLSLAQEGVVMQVGTEYEFEGTIRHTSFRLTPADTEQYCFFFHPPNDKLLIAYPGPQLENIENGCRVSVKGVASTSHVLYAQPEDIHVASTCPECEGSGRRTDRCEARQDESGNDIFPPCKTCRGTGSIY
jgi:hypothetical protein